VRVDPDRDLGYPDDPFTRGVYPSMYRGRLWTMRQFAGFGTAEETNERFRYLLDHGQTGLSTAFDMPTLMGYDSDHARSLGEVGREGGDRLARRHGDALRRHPARRGLDLDDDQRPRGDAARLHICVAEQQGVPRAELRGRSRPTSSRSTSRRRNGLPPEPRCGS
jgi:methylmalonyl-CoA mutase N-terminal domain/subunit